MPTTAPPVTSRQKRERRRTARRDSILAAARKVFQRQGFDGGTVADIAREAGVASGTVYLYFPSKLDLFAALNARLFEVINEAMQVTAPRDVLGGTGARIRAVFAACGEHRDLLRLILLNPDPRTEVARRMKHADEERSRPLAELLRQGMVAGTVRQGDPMHLARLVTGVVTIALYQCFVQSDGRDVQAYENTVARMIVGGLTRE